MSLDALIRGRVRGDPQRRLTKSGRDYATARLAITDADGQQHLVCLICFDADVVQKLLALADGDALAVAGELSVSTYTTKTGEARPALRLTVRQALTPYHLRRRREAAGGPHKARTPPAADRRTSQPLPDDGDILAMPDDPL